MDEGESDRMMRERQRFEVARRDPDLIRGKVLPSARVIQGRTAWNEAGTLSVTMTRSREGPRGYFYVSQPEISATIHADFLESSDRRERIFMLTLIGTQKGREQGRRFKLNSRLLGEIADLVQTIHAQFGPPPPVTFLLPSSDMIYADDLTNEELEERTGSRRYD